MIQCVSNGREWNVVIRKHDFQSSFYGHVILVVVVVVVSFISAPSK